MDGDVVDSTAVPPYDVRNPSTVSLGPPGVAVNTPARVGVAVPLPRGPPPSGGEPPREEGYAAVVAPAIPADAPHAARARLAERLATLRLVRAPITQCERDTAAVAAYALSRAIQRQTAGRNIAVFPLRKDRKRRPVKVPPVRSALFGPGTVSLPKSWSVPVSPDEDCVAVATLPETRRIAELAANEAGPNDAMPTVGPPISLPWRVDGTLPPGRWAWGREARISDLPLHLRNEWRKLIEKEWDSGAIEVVLNPSAVRLITPVFIAYHPATLKPRLVHDLRALNVRLQVATASYDNIRMALLHRRRLGTKLDLASAFKHVEIDEEASSVMAFSFEGVLFRWRRLPFGMAHSPSFFVAALRPTIEALRAEGIRLVVYVDDILVLADSAAELDTHAARVMQRLREDGWRLAPDKCYPWAHDRIVFLGILLDLRTGTAHVPAGKARKFLALVSVCLAAKRIPLSTLQKLAGTLAFFLIAAPNVGLAWNGIRMAMVEASYNPGRYVTVRGGLQEDLKFWVAAAGSLPTWPAYRAHEGVVGHLVTDAGDASTGALWWGGREPAPSFEEWRQRDATTRGRLGTEIYELTADEREEASATRELLGLWKPLLHRFGAGADPGTWTQAISPQQRVRQLAALSGTGKVVDPISVSIGSTRPTGPGTTSGNLNANSGICESAAYPAPDAGTRVVRWTCDSAAGVAAIGKWRSRSEGVARVLLAIASFCVVHRLIIIPTWVSREADWLPVADFLSRGVGRTAQAEWSVPRVVLSSWLNKLKFQPTTDMFASKRNRLFDNFYSQFAEQGSLGNALDSPWPSKAYAFPPFALVPLAMAQFAMSAPPGARALFVLPEVTPQSFFSDVRVLGSAEWPTEARLLNQAGVPALGPPPRPIRAWLLERPLSPPAVDPP